MDRFENDVRDICLKLARMRLARNLSAYALSTKLGKNKNYISRIEAGDTNITLKALFEICHVLGIAARELFQ